MICGWHVVRQIFLKRRDSGITRLGTNSGIKIARNLEVERSAAVWPTVGHCGYDAKCSIDRFAHRKINLEVRPVRTIVTNGNTKGSVLCLKLTFRSLAHLVEDNLVVETGSAIGDAVPEFTAHADRRQSAERIYARSRWSTSRAIATDLI